MRAVKCATQGTPGPVSVSLLELVGHPFHIKGATLPPASMPPARGQHTRTVLARLLGIEHGRLDELARQGRQGRKGGRSEQK